MAVQPRRVASTRRLAAGMLTCFVLGFFNTSLQGTVSDHETVQLSEGREANQNSPPFFFNAFTISAPLLGHQQPPTNTRSPILMEWDGKTVRLGVFVVFPWRYSK